MKKKGFTLIELLAVIVILAIIALIASPIIINTIEESNRKSAVLSVGEFIKASKTYYSNELTNNKGVFNENQDLTITLPSNLIPTDGDPMDDGKVLIKTDGNVLITEVIEIKKYYCGYDDKDEIYCSKDMYDDKLSIKTEDGSLIQMQDIKPSTLGLVDIGDNESDDCIINGTCSADDIASGLSIDIDVNGEDTFKFYVIADDGEKVTLMMDDALFNSEWITFDDYANVFGSECENAYGCHDMGPITGLERLLEETAGWKNIPPIDGYEFNDGPGNYGYDSLTYEDGILTVKGKSGKTYTIGATYNKVKARLISAQEIAEIAGLEWEARSGVEESLDMISWIYQDDSEHGFITSSTYTDDDFAVWDVYAGGYWWNASDIVYGVKPVITVPKMGADYDPGALPVVTYSFAKTPNANGWLKENQKVTVKVTDRDSSVSEVKYCVDTKKCTPNQTTNDSEFDIDVTSESETNYVCVQAKNTNGKQSSVKCTDAIKIDKTAPTLNTEERKIFTYKTSYNFAQDVDAADNFTRDWDLQISTSGTITFGTIGTYNINYTITDLAGNVTSGVKKVSVISPEGQKLVELPAGKTKDTLALGDVVTIKSENFYYFGTEGTGADERLLLFSAYNLHVGGTYDDSKHKYEVYENPTGLQDRTMRGYTGGDIQYGTVPFSSRVYWPTTGYLNLNEYKVDGAYPAEATAINHAQAYKDKLIVMDPTLNGFITTRLPMDDDVMATTEDDDLWLSIADYAFWLGYNSEDYPQDAVCFVIIGNQAYFLAQAYYNESIVGVRPIVELKTSYFN